MKEKKYWVNVYFTFEEYHPYGNCDNVFKDDNSLIKIDFDTLNELEVKYNQLITKMEPMIENICKDRIKDKINFVKTFYEFCDKHDESINVSFLGVTTWLDENDYVLGERMFNEASLIVDNNLIVKLMLQHDGSIHVYETPNNIRIEKLIGRDTYSRYTSNTPSNSQITDQIKNNYKKKVFDYFVIIGSISGNTF